MSILEKAFELSVVISAIDRLTGPFKTAGASMNHMQKQIDTVSKSMKSMSSSSADIDKVTQSLKDLERAKGLEKLTNDLRDANVSEATIANIAAGMEKLSSQADRMEKLAVSYERFKKTAVTGAVMTGGGFFAADGLIKALDMAGEFQTKLTVIQDATGATTDGMKKLGDTIMTTSTQVSKFNDMQTAGFAQQLSAGGFLKIADVQKLLLPVSQFAEVQMYEGKQESPEESVKQSIEMAHLFGHYDVKGFTDFLNTFNKYSLMQPGSSSDLQQTLKYLEPVAGKQMKMSEADVMALAAIDNRVGLTGSHGGTNSADMILRLIPGLIGGMPTAKKTPLAYKAFEDLGLVDSKTGESKFFKNGQVTNLDKMLNTLITSIQGKTPEKITTDFKEIFGIQGGRAAGILSDPQVIAQLQNMKNQLPVTKDVDTIQKDIRATPQGQVDTAKSNSMTLMLRAATQTAELMTPFLNKLNSILEKMLAFTQLHPKVAKYVALFAVMGTGLLLVAGPLTGLIGLFGMLGTGIKMLKIAEFAKSLKLVQLATKAWSIAQAAFNIVMSMNPIALIIIGIVALIAVIVLLVTHWKQVVDWLGKVWDMLKGLGKSASEWGGNIIHGLWEGIKGAGDWFKGLFSKFIDEIIPGPIKKFLGLGSPSGANTPMVGPPIPKHAYGGIFSSPHIGMIGEAGTEAVIPLSNKRRGMDLWMQTGKMLGVFNSKSNFMSSPTTDLSPRNSGNSIGELHVHIHPKPYQDAKEIAREVLRELGNITRGQNMNMGISINQGAF